MTDIQSTGSDDRPDPPGKTRTWWHPLLARLLDHALATGYRVLEEVLVGKLPLRLDILLICREAGQLSAARRQDVDILLPLLNRFTLIQFKGPTDALQPGDLAQLRTSWPSGGNRSCRWSAACFFGTGSAYYDVAQLRCAPAASEKDQDMIALQGTVRNGQIILDDSVDLREGTRVKVLSIETRGPTLAMREEDWSTTAEGIAALLARMDEVEPEWLLPEDEAAWRAALGTQKEIEKARFFEHAENLRRMWE